MSHAANLLADGEGPPAVVQAAWAPDPVVRHLGPHVAALANKQAVLDLLLGAVVVREGPAAAGAEVGETPAPDSVPRRARPRPRAYLARVRPMPLSANLGTEQVVRRALSRGGRGGQDGCRAGTRPGCCVGRSLCLSPGLLRGLGALEAPPTLPDSEGKGRGAAA